MRAVVIAMLCVAFLVLGAAVGLGVFGDDDDEPTTSTPTTGEAPELFTNANGEDVWARPGYHLGARVRIQGRVVAVQAGQDGKVVAMVVNGYPVGAYIFDPNFAVGRGDRIEVVGDVRGPLGGELTLGIPLFGPLGQGAAVIDAAQARQLK